VKTEVTSTRKANSGWRFIACLILITFTLQSYITQTHIHNATPVAITKVFPHSQGKTPLDDNPMDCPFCQAVAHDGPFFFPTVLLLILSVEFIELAAPAFHLHRSLEQLAHIWQSRAPPHP